MCTSNVLLRDGISSTPFFQRLTINPKLVGIHQEMHFSRETRSAPSEWWRKKERKINKYDDSNKQGSVCQREMQKWAYNIGYNRGKMDSTHHICLAPSFCELSANLKDLNQKDVRLKK